MNIGEVVIAQESDHVIQPDGSVVGTFNSAPAIVTGVKKVERRKLNPNPNLPDLPETETVEIVTLTVFLPDEIEFVEAEAYSDIVGRRPSYWTYRKIGTEEPKVKFNPNERPRTVDREENDRRRDL